ncbi:MAG: PDC sensor domain-containing protein [Granulosicoccaceae bacterium]|jgi:hypothetical protein
MSLLQLQISEKKAMLAELVNLPMQEIAGHCVAVWPDANKLDEVLVSAREALPHAHLLYVLSKDGVQMSSNVERTTVDTDWRGRDQSKRPYLMNNLPYRGIMLSSVYLSLRTHKQCITALHSITINDELVGFLAADFAVTDLPAAESEATEEFHWQQFRGDPAVRGTVFMQQRSTSLLDEHIDEVHELFNVLMTEHGVFHAKIHYSSGRCSLWLLEDPYNYLIHSVDEIIDPDICLAYPLHAYPDNARIPPEVIKDIFDQFKALRFADETIYLRSASINLMNGILGLTFSCDGSHYMPYEEFLDRDLAFWLGAGTQREETA